MMMLAFNPALGVPVTYKQMQAKIDKEDARLDLAMEKIAELERELELRDLQGLDEERSALQVAYKSTQVNGELNGAVLDADRMRCPDFWADDDTEVEIKVSKKGPFIGHQTAVFKIVGDGCYTAQLFANPDAKVAVTRIDGPMDCNSGMFEGERKSKPGSYGPLHDKDTRLSSKQKICDAFMGATRSWANGGKYSVLFHNCQTFANKIKSLIKGSSTKV